MKFLILFLSMLATGCSLLTPTPTSFAVYDFGPSSTYAAAPSSAPSQIPVQVATIEAPIWLEGQAIRYRLAYYDPARTYVYANSQWAASPSELLTERIRQNFSANTEPKSDENRSFANYLLKITLEEFMQIFDTADSSHVVIYIRAALHKSDHHQPIATRNFSKKLLTPTADAAGAVVSFITASDSLADELVQWTSDFPR